MTINFPLLSRFVKVLFQGFPGVRQVKSLMLTQYEIVVGVKPRISTLTEQN